MSKISNTAAYPNATPLIGDYVIGTVASSLETKTFTIGDIIGLVSDNTLSEVLAAGNTATNDIDLTGNLEVDGDVTISSTIFLDGLIDIASAIPLRMTAITAYDDDAAAALAGLTQGDVYQTTAANPNGAGVLMVKQ